MNAEPPFPGCPCWMCMGDFTCCWLLCGQEIPEAVRTILAAGPLLFLRDRDAAKSLAVGMIRRYQVEVSARTPARCRYRPTCSNYGIAALEHFGVATGIRLILKRLSRCRRSVPWGTPDPVPLHAGL